MNRNEPRRTATNRDEPQRTDAKASATVSGRQGKSGVRDGWSRAANLFAAPMIFGAGR
jgi:hypothetical protein